MESNLVKQDIQSQAETLTVQNLVKNISRGQVRIPSFQRGLRWEAQDVVDLFDSIYRGYPIGSLLFSKGSAPVSKITIGILKIDAPEDSSARWVVDGQQRITALTAALLHPASPPLTPDDVWVVYFDAEKQTFNTHPKDNQIPANWVLVAELLDEGKLSEWVYNWTEGQNVALRTATFEAGARIRQYQVPIYTVENGNEDFLRDVFHRTNNYGKSLKWSEVHDAIFGNKGENHFSTLDDLARELEHLGMGKPEEQLLLTCLIAFRGLDVTRGFVEHYRRDPKVLQDAVQEALPVINSVFSFLRTDAEIPHLRLLPRATPLPILIRFFALHREPNPRSLTLLSRWTWRTLLGKRLVDERTLLRRAVSAIKTDEEASVQSLLSFVSNRKPSDFVLPSQFDARSAESRIALLGLASLKPLDFYDGNPIDVAELIENYEIGAFRKIVPTNKGNGRSPANRIFSSGIGAARRDIVEQSASLWSRDEIWQSHAISPAALDALKAEKNDDFLKERRKMLENAVTQFGNRLAAWEQNDRPSIDYLVKQGADEE